MLSHSKLQQNSVPFFIYYINCPFPHLRKKKKKKGDVSSNSANLAKVPTQVWDVYTSISVPPPSTRMDVRCHMR